MAQKTDMERHPDRYFISPKGHIRDRIVIHENSELPKEGMFIGLNGFHFLAKAGVEIDIPRPVRLMLDTRIKTETRTIDLGNGRVEAQTRNMPRITYTLIKEGVNLNVNEKLPSPEVIDAGADSRNDVLMDAPVEEAP